MPTATKTTFEKYAALRTKAREKQAELEAMAERGKTPSAAMLDEISQMADEALKLRAELDREQANRQLALIADNRIAGAHLLAGAMGNGHDQLPAGLVLAGRPGETAAGDTLIADTIDALLEHKDLPAGVERRKDGFHIPMSAGAEMTVQADATGTANVPHPSNVRTWPLVRHMNVLDFLGVYPEPQPPGKLIAAWMTTSPPAVTEGEMVALGSVDTAHNILAEDELEPRRTYVARSFTTEAGHEHGPMRIRTLLDEDARTAMAEGLQAQVLNGNGNAPNMKGLFSSALQIRAASAAADTWGSVVTAVESAIDGKYATRPEDLRMVMRSETSAFLASLISSPGGDSTALSYLNQRTGGIRISDQAPAPTAGEKLHRILMRRGMRPGAYVWPMWANQVLTVDPITGAPRGTKYYLQTVHHFQAAESVAQGRGDWVILQIRSMA